MFCFSFYPPYQLLLSVHHWERSWAFEHMKQENPVLLDPEAGVSPPLAPVWLGIWSLCTLEQFTDLGPKGHIVKEKLDEWEQPPWEGGLEMRKLGYPEGGTCKSLHHGG